MKLCKYPVYFFFVFVAALNTKAQIKSVLPLKKVPVNTINYEQGLLNNETATIITDTLGFTWMSTTTGLQRYNGYTLENIDPVINHNTIRITIRIRSRIYFYKLKNGNLWISCKKGVLEYNPFTNVFKNIIPVDCAGDDVFAIMPLCETKEGVWCIKKGAGFVIYNTNGQLKKAVPSVNINILDGIIGSDNIKSSSIISSNQDHIFIRTSTNTILDFNTRNYAFDEIKSVEEILSVACNTHFLYFETHDYLFKFGISDEKLVNSYPFKYINKQIVVSGCVHAIGNNRVIVTVNDQVIELDANLNNPKLLTTFNGRPILLTGSVEHIYHDALQRIWLLTNDDIKRIQDKEIPFSYLKYPDANSNFVRCLYFDEHTGQLLAGCINGGLQVYDKASNPLWHEPLQINDFKDVLAIDKLSTNTYLIITWSRGWYLLNLIKRELTVFNFPAGESSKKLLYNNTFSSNIQRLNDSTLLVACVANVFRCVFRGNNLISVKPLLPFYRSVDDRVNCAFYDSNGALWVGQYHGEVYRIDKNGKGEVVGLPEKFGTRCFAEDDKHHIWIGTNSGLYVCTLKGLLLKSFNKRSGLLNDCIYSMLPLPGKSAVIASSNMGLSDISLSGNIKNYTKELGLQDNEFNTAAALMTASGKFYFGGVNGINSFYPSALIESGSNPVLNMTRLVVNDSTYNSSGIWKGDAIHLNYDQNHLQFDFAAMGPLNADKYFYKYRLIGFEKNWQSTNLPIGIRYILQPGNYTLEVACSSDLSGTEVKKNFLIAIHPPFWLTWWFFFVMGLCGIGAMVLIVTYYNKRKYQKTLQELIVNQRLQSQRERISRDLHDNLGAQANAIFYGTELLKQNGIDGHQLVNNLHDTAGDMLTVLRETLWAMKINEVEATDLWLRVLNFSRKIGMYYLDIKMNISGAPPAMLAINASMALNIILIVQEAINNAIRHSEASVISVSSYSNEHSWRIEIVDDGKGFDLLALKKKAESYGLDNMAERARESNIQFAINSVPSHGTKVFLEINLQNIES